MKLGIRYIYIQDYLFSLLLSCLFVFRGRGIWKGGGCSTLRLVKGHKIEFYMCYARDSEFLSVDFSWHEAFHSFWSDRHTRDWFGSLCVDEEVFLGYYYETLFNVALIQSFVVDWA